MNYLEELRTLDVKDVGRWPLVFRGVAVRLIFVLVAVGGTYYFVWRNKIPQLEQVEPMSLPSLRWTAKSDTLE